MKTFTMNLSNKTWETIKMLTNGIVNPDQSLKSMEIVITEAFNKVYGTNAVITIEKKS